jgi:hypothetical protein
LGMQNRTLGPYLAENNRIRIPEMVEELTAAKNAPNSGKAAEHHWNG